MYCLLNMRTRTTISLQINPAFMSTLTSTIQVIGRFIAMASTMASYQHVHHAFLQEDVEPQVDNEGILKA